MLRLQRERNAAAERGAGFSLGHEDELLMGHLSGEFVDGWLRFRTKGGIRSGDRD